MGLIVNNIESRRAGVQAQLMDTWRQQYPVFAAQQALWVRFLESSKPTLRKAPFAWKESIPFPEPWPYGSARTFKTLKDIKIDISIYPYNLSVPFSGWDEDDDQLGDMRTHLSQVAKRFLQLPDKLISEYLTGTRSLNFVLNNAYDGVDIFNATDGAGAARFGVTGGNILTGGGVTTAGISQDFANAQQRFMEFLDPSGDSPIFAEADVDYSRMHAIIPPALNEAFQTLTKSEYLRTDLTNAVSQSNWLKGTFQYHINPYLTDNSDWYIVIDHGYWKPFVYRYPGEKGLRQIFQDFNNSDHARLYNEYAVMADLRVGLGPWAPFTTIKVNN